MSNITSVLSHAANDVGVQDLDLQASDFWPKHEEQEHVLCMHDK